ncbi:MAG: ELM1/GtrOC1 family putative glycosyltransferase [Pseudomonadota bacterium]
MADPLRLAVLTDGRAGNRTLGLGVAEAIARQRPAEIVEGEEGLAEADLIIGAGQAGNRAAARARRRLRRPAVAVLRPPLPWLRFDAIVVPEHDGLSGPGVFTTLGAPNRLTREGLARAGADHPLGPRALVALIGGPSRSAGFDADALIADLARFRAAGFSLHATTSRRTPADLPDRLREARPEMMVWDGSGANPYPGWLAHAAAILVTADSVNMGSEAAATGRPIFISGEVRLARKLRHFHSALRARGIARPAADGPADWSYAPLAEADRIAPALIAHLGLDGPRPRRAE